MVAPPDADDVLLGLRLGWAVAEVRGGLHDGSTAPAPRRPDRALPLSDERGWAEQTIETEEVLCHLAQTLKVDFNMDGGQSETASERLRRLSKELASARAHGDERRTEVTWGNAAEFFYLWDAKIQDELAAGSFAVASAYQLGRGLAEIYWMLDPAATEETDPRSVRVLLGSVRQQAFARLLPRLSAYFPESGSTAVAASVLAWARAAEDGLFQEDATVVEALHEQLRVWHDLLLVGQAPEARVGTKDLLSRARRIGPVLRAFIPEVSIGLLSLAAAGVAAALFALGKGNAALAPVLSVVSFFGVTGAGALAKAKGEAHTLFDRLRLAMNADLLKESVTLPPARAYLDEERRGRGPLGPAPKDRAMQELEATRSQSPLAPMS
jgi:hypothetical protein